MEAPDDYTVVFTTEVPNAVFLDRLNNRFMISKAAADKYGDQADEHPNGTGSLQVRQLAAGRQFRLDAQR